MEENVLEDNPMTVRDFASQINLQSSVTSPVAYGSFGEVHRCAINEGKTEVCDSLSEQHAPVHFISTRLQ